MVVKRADQTHPLRPQTSGQYTSKWRDARAVSVRAATPHDKEKLRQRLSRLPPQTIHWRFHHAYPRVPEQLLDLMLDVDHYDKESLLALA